MRLIFNDKTTSSHVVTHNTQMLLPMIFKWLLCNEKTWSVSTYDAYCVRLFL